MKAPGAKALEAGRNCLLLWDVEGACEVNKYDARQIATGAARDEGDATTVGSSPAPLRPFAGLSKLGLMVFRRMVFMCPSVLVCRLFVLFSQVACRGLVAEAVRSSELSPSIILQDLNTQVFPAHHCFFRRRMYILYHYLKLMKLLTMSFVHVP